MEEMSANLLEAEPSFIPHSALCATDLDRVATEVVRDAIALFEKARSIRLEWDQKYNPTEPILSNLEDCVELFIQSQQIRFPSDLFEESDEHYYPENRESATRGSNAERGGTLVAEVESGKLADAIAELPEAQVLEQAISLAHSEDIDTWIEIVATALTQPMGLSELVEKLDLSVVQVWIALMFGEFHLERTGDFYEGSIVVSPSKDPPQAL
ncbi:hypothetical protein NIES2135_26770 [Leptolyngbya boryana NIES-2135]|jgi:hypothetical protein|uniref:Uncharacterized protein n=2 Tax=Leptolyngbya group TaxID=3081713 RepID=A0A1Z4JGG1_LEPBY|nr:hypothetical protein LBWT_39050 [Leptolyngbya boryana IAM M-101]BAS64288.1 hypothetical protein LBDG_39050 [Leptolyngbya boryana dg5]BAY55852.1 hypothetical protein NIES2135_26770 [Leptolyngbya boryana NIES-2135]